MLVNLLDVLDATLCKLTKWLVLLLADMLNEVVSIDRHLWNLCKLHTLTKVWLVLNADWFHSGSVLSMNMRSVIVTSCCIWHWHQHLQIKVKLTLKSNVSLNISSNTNHCPNIALNLLDYNQLWIVSIALSTLWQ